MAGGRGGAGRRTCWSGAPLELSGLTPSAEAGLADRIRDRSFEAWADTAAAVGYCSQPVRLSGSSTTIDATTGEVLDTFSSRHDAQPPS